MMLKADHGQVLQPLRIKGMFARMEDSGVMMQEITVTKAGFSRIT